MFKQLILGHGDSKCPIYVLFFIIIILFLIFVVCFSFILSQGFHVKS